ncbi:MULTISPECIES: ATP-binding protein [Pontibacter]|uniref:histidine kinase n=1 Tax=Pontibacter lucknowensis TaxID=1077936 RepID=A0A1N6YG21_9BACT|nr:MULTISPECIES: GAF domain-containing sensor histidine kinase [Pontibacter]EJF10264.1 GAF sensor signal transduction histidine kinase [Pontibacter sp. BAB1700]SIR13517.1 Signal transduction histidine kinase [Pontibacter lucknowensis]
MIEIQDNLLKDLEAVRQIPIVPSMLETVCQLTGMGFSAVARVTEDRWLACSVRDQVHFGLKEGDELEIATTLCNEIRDHRQPIVIDNVSEDPAYKDHHTPRIYGLQSYISVPIILKDGTFFGTLCAIDANPAKVNNPKVINTFRMFADLLAFHLQSRSVLERSYVVNLELQRKNSMLRDANFDLDSFVFTASHDLKSPVANIEGLLSILSDAVSKEEMDREEIKQITAMMKTSLKRFSATIRDLTTIVELDKAGADEKAAALDLYDIMESVKQDLQSLIVESGAEIEVIATDSRLTGFSLRNFKSILTNLVSNAIKYRSPDRTPEVIVKLEKSDGKSYLSVQDNGLGIPAKKQHNVFTMFKRLHNHVEGSGIGLYIVKRMVDRVQGEIKVESELDKGTTFTIVF